MVRLIRDLCADRKGVTLIEYGLIAALVSTTVIGVLSNLGVTLRAFYTTISASLAAA